MTPSSGEEDLILFRFITGRQKGMINSSRECALQLYVVFLKMKKYLSVIFYVCMGSIAGFSQTNYMNLVWDQTSESDIVEHLLYRSLNGSTTFSYVGQAPYPDTTMIDSIEIKPGNLYSYRLIAMDSSGYTSGFSNTASGGIPQINWLLTDIFSAETTAVNLDDFLFDPDHQNFALNITISQLDHLQLILSGQDLILIPSPLDYVGPASFSIRVEDPTHFWDQKFVELNILINDTPIIADSSQQISDKFILFQNYPNPFNSQTKIYYALFKNDQIKVEIFDLIGKKIATLYQGPSTMGFHSIEFQADQLPSGIYYYQLTAGSHSEARKMILYR
jgi:hypothetical protein